MGCCRASKVESSPAAGVGLCGRAAIHTFNGYRGVQALDVSAHFFAVIAWFSGPRTAIAVTGGIHVINIGNPVVSQAGKAYAECLCVLAFLLALCFAKQLIG